MTKLRLFDHYRGHTVGYHARHCPALILKSPHRFTARVLAFAAKNATA